uniref:Uncharacterized protein n=1 Tax=Salix viminalis TaxID=40686 RepID=A0A6N2MJ03_SALVM
MLTIMNLSPLKSPWAQCSIWLHMISKRAIGVVQIQTNWIQQGITTSSTLALIPPEKQKKRKVLQKEEDDNNLPDSARSSFSLALKESGEEIQI